MDFIGGLNVDLNNVHLTFDDTSGGLGTVWKVDGDMNLLQCNTDTIHPDGVAQFVDCEAIADHIETFYCCDRKKPEGLTEFLEKVRKF